MQRTHSFFSWLMTAMLAVWSVSALAQSASQQTAPHEPYTMSGMFVRGELRLPGPYGTAMKMPPMIFHETSPCRLVSTRAEDAYPAQWGGPAFQPGDRREYPVQGELKA